MSLPAGNCFTSLRNCSADFTGWRLIFEDHIATRQASIFRRAAGCTCATATPYLRGQVQLLPDIRSKIGDRDAQPGVTGFVTGGCRDFLVLVVFANGQVNLLGWPFRTTSNWIFVPGATSLTTT
jgi:hypothetical protein